MAGLQLFLHLVMTFITLSLDKGETVTLDDCPKIPGSTKWDDYTKVFGDSCYRFYLWENRNYQAAQAECARGGGTLVMIKSEGIQNFILGEIKKFKLTYPIWIGLNDRVTEGVYTWEDGTRLGSSDYSNWGRWEGPRHLIGTIGQNEDCVFLSPEDGEWKDGSCEWGIMTSLVHEDRSFVCQYKIVSTTTVKTTTKQDTTQSTTTQISTKSSVTKPPSTTPATTQSPTTTKPSTTPATTQAPTTTKPSTTPATTQAPTTTKPSTTPAPTQAPSTTPAPTQAPSTTQPPAPTSPRVTTSGPIIDCGSFSCSLDCGMDGYQKNATTECPICKCNT